MPDFAGEQLDGMVHDVAQGLGSPLPPRSPHAKALRVGTYSLEPFECGYLPLLVYVVTHGVFPAISHYFLRKRGFVQSQDCGVLVWTEQQALQRRAGGAAGAPIVLIHGIGVGLLPYMSLIRQLFEAERGLMVGHSYGSLVSSWMLQLDPSIVSGSVLIDPVALFLHRVDTLFSFIYAGSPKP
ncbi:hypothetical protein T484DRAFT_1825587 [Baffinella frigidus]|nr:hypothetical protein T484DRAFT_1825587 [Cryptophyta sp. CCMP2293]